MSGKVNHNTHTHPLTYPTGSLYFIILYLCLAAKQIALQGQIKLKSFLAPHWQKSEPTNSNETRVRPQQKCQSQHATTLQKVQHQRKNKVWNIRFKVIIKRAPPTERQHPSASCYRWAVWQPAATAMHGNIRTLPDTNTVIITHTHSSQQRALRCTRAAHSAEKGSHHWCEPAERKTCHNPSSGSLTPKRQQPPRAPPP